MTTLNLSNVNLVESVIFTKLIQNLMGYILEIRTGEGFNGLWIMVKDESADEWEDYIKIVWGNDDSLISDYTKGVEAIVLDSQG